MSKKFNSVVEEIMEAAGNAPSVLDAPGAETMADADVDSQATTPENDPNSRETSVVNSIDDGVTDNESEEEEDLDDFFVDDDEEEEDEDSDYSDEDEEDEDSDEDEEDEDSDDEEEEDEQFEVDDDLVAESISNLFKGENLNEEFVSKARTITETYLRAAAKQIHDKINTNLQERYSRRLANNVKKTQNRLVEQLDKYLDYVVEEWMRENQLAVETGIRAEISETFMSKLHQVFTESYVDVPESKVDLVQELTDKCQNLKEHNQNAINTAIHYKKLYESSKRDSIVSALSEGLSTNRAAKLAKLAENVSADNLVEFEEKVKTIRESIAASKNPSKAHDNFDFSGKETIMEDKTPTNDAVREALASLDRLSKVAHQK